MLLGFLGLLLTWHFIWNEEGEFGRLGHNSPWTSHQMWTGKKPGEPKTFWPGRESSSSLGFPFHFCFHPLNCEYARMPPVANWRTNDLKSADGFWGVPVNGCLVSVNGSAGGGSMVCVPLREHNRWCNTHGCHATATGAPHTHTHTRLHDMQACLEANVYPFLGVKLY